MDRASSVVPVGAWEIVSPGEESFEVSQVNFESKAPEASKPSVAARRNDGGGDDPVDDDVAVDADGLGLGVEEQAATEASRADTAVADMSVRETMSVTVGAAVAAGRLGDRSFAT